MELNCEEYNEDECELKYFSAISVIEVFTIKNREYFKLDPEDCRNKTNITKKEKEIEIIIENIRKKYDYLIAIKACKNKTHSKLAFDLNHIFEDNKRMINSFNKEKALKAEIIRKFKDIELYLSSDEDYNLENKGIHIFSKDIKGFQNDKNIKNENVEDMMKIKFNYNGKEDKNNIDYEKINETKDFGIENIAEKKDKLMLQINSDIDSNTLGEIDLYMLEQILENSKEYLGDEEFRKNLIYLKDQIKDISLGLENGIILSNEKLNSISDDIMLVDNNVSEINRNLKEAALEKNKFNKIKYPALLGGIGSTLGLLVPGFGSIIGGSIGSLLGYYLSKLEKKQIEKIDKSNK